MEKAYWVRHQYLKSADPAAVAPEFEWHLRQQGCDPANGPALVEVIVQQRERCRTLLEMAEKSKFFYADVESYNEKDAAKHLTAKAVPVLRHLIDGLNALGDWQAESIHGVVHAVAEQLGLKLGEVAQPIRVAVSGAAVSPPIDQTLQLLGREQTVARLAAAADYAAQPAPAV